MCIEAGMDDYLSKPFRPGELLEAINRCLLNLGETAEPSSPNNSSGIAVLTKEGVLNFLEGNLTLLGELTEYIREACPDILAELQQGLAAGDAHEVETKAHELKATLGVIGENAAQEAAHQLELAANRGELEAGAHMLDRCRAESERLLTSLAEFVAEEAV